MKYYHRAKGLVEPDKWPSFRDKMLAKNEGLRFSADSPLAEIYKEENLIDRLYDHMSNANANLLSALTRYARDFTPQQQERLVSRLEKAFPDGFYGANRKTYQEIAGRLNMLARTCPAGKRLALKILAGYRAKFPGRPALMDELDKVKV